MNSPRSPWIRNEPFEPLRVISLWEAARLIRWYVSVAGPRPVPWIFISGHALYMHALMRYYVYTHVVFSEGISARAMRSKY